MEIRLAFPNEVDAIMQVMEDAKKCLADAGSDQWQNGYPNADVIIDDIISGQAYVALEEGELASWRVRVSSLSPYCCGSRCAGKRSCSNLLRGLD